MSFLMICFVLFGSTANLQKMILFLTDVLKKTEREGGREREVRMSWKSTFAGTAKNVAFTQILNFWSNI